MSKQDTLQLLTARYLDLFSMAMAIVRDPDDARDALQEALVSTLTRPWLHNPYAYCRKALRNNCIKVLRRRNRIVPTACIVALTDEPYQDAPDRAWQLQNELPEHLKALTKLHYEAGYTLAELAAITGQSTATVKRLLEKARLELRNKMNEQEQ